MVMYVSQRTNPSPPVLQIYMANLLEDMAATVVRTITHAFSHARFSSIDSIYIYIYLAMKVGPEYVLPFLQAVDDLCFEGVE